MDQPSRRGEPPMTRAHFQLIADVVRDADFGHAGNDLREPLAEAFAKRLRRCNPNFDWDRFIEACLKDT